MIKYFYRSLILVYAVVHICMYREIRFSTAKRINLEFRSIVIVASPIRIYSSTIYICVYIHVLYVYIHICSFLENLIIKFIFIVSLYDRFQKNLIKQALMLIVYILIIIIIY